ncbi:MAG: lysophospholipid acyltransferase family protein [Gammaproteobacteria bacterium]
MSSPDKPRNAASPPSHEQLPRPANAGGAAVAFQGEARRVSARVSTWLSTWLKYLALRTTALTWRSATQGLDELDARLASGEGCIVVCWHGKYLALSPLLRGRRACVFTSCSRRGSLVADICNRFGFVPVQIPDGKHDHKLSFMKEALRQHRAGALTVDGPTGPYHLVKRGAVTLASELGYCIFPVSVASNRAHVLSQRWDQLEIPKLFARVCMCVASPIRIPPNLNEDQVLALSDVLHDELEALDRMSTEQVRAETVSARLDH